MGIQGSGAARCGQHRSREKFKRRTLIAVQDDEYIKAGASIATRKDAFSQNITLKLRPPDINSEVPAFRDGTR